jgi:hypothetical protein
MNVKLGLSLMGRNTVKLYENKADNRIMGDKVIKDWRKLHND